jgi:FAD/FMN-containing dehydrogenase
MAKYAVEELRKTVRGAVLCPGEEGYEAARKVPNAMIDRKPTIIVRCAGPADVISCVRFAREHDLLVSIRGGGHSIAGKAVCDGGLMIDLSCLKGIRVDPQHRTARGEPGLTLGEFDQETQAFGLATALGTVSKTGIAGLTLGGGFGHLSGKYGLACDNLIGADVVTADGRLLKANASENQDLFWGVRGGGGNFGIVTSFEYRLHEITTVLGGAVLYPATKAKEILPFFKQFAEASPDELVIQAGAMTMNGVPVFLVGGCYCGSLNEGEKLLKSLRTFGSPIADMFAPVSYGQMQSMFDPFFPPGRQTYVKANFIRSLSDKAVDALAEFAGTSPSVHTFGPWVEHWHGAATRVALSDTAFPHRQYPYNFSVWSNWVSSSESEENIKWSRACWDAMRPFMADGSYVNYLEDEGDPLARAAYGLNYDRLVALKNKYDPTNFFRMNHNIKPTQAAQA